MNISSNNSNISVYAVLQGSRRYDFHAGMAYLPADHAGDRLRLFSVVNDVACVHGTRWVLS